MFDLSAPQYLVIQSEVECDFPFTTGSKAYCEACANRLNSSEEWDLDEVSFFVIARSEYQQRDYELGFGDFNWESLKKA